MALDDMPAQSVGRAHSPLDIHFRRRPQLPQRGALQRFRTDAEGRSRALKLRYRQAHAADRDAVAQRDISQIETAGVDAHYGVAKTYDYYFNVHGRNGIDGAG